MRKTSMPVIGASLDERPDDVVGIVRVADGVARAQQHLEQDVRESAGAAAPAAPTGSSCRKRIDVSNVAPPHISRLNRSGIGRATASATAQHVVGAHARRQQRLMRVAQRRVGDAAGGARRAPMPRTSSGPARCSCWRVPGGAAPRRAARAAARRRQLAPVERLPFTSGRPLTMTSPRYDEHLRGPVARRAESGTAPACRR